MPMPTTATLRIPAFASARAASLAVALGVACVALAARAPRADAAVTYTISGTWDTQARRDAAVAAMNSSTALYNNYAGSSAFNKSITVTYNAGVATADANWNGSLRFGGTWPGHRVALHEISHTLGVGTTSNWANLMTGGTWDGPRASALARQFDGDATVLRGDAAHFWPYGLNFDSEASTVNNLRHVAMVYALRADMGLGTTAPPSSATAVSLVASDALGNSGFNHASTWSDGHFPRAAASYTTGDFAVRSPASAASFTFAGSRLTVNNTADPNGGFYYKGSGTAGVVTVPDLVLDGGWIHHLSGAGDLFRLAGRLTVTAPSMIRAKQGNIHLEGVVAGTGTITIPANDFGATDNGYVRMLSPSNTFTGSLDIAGRFELADDAVMNFVVGAPGISNAITGPGARRVVLAGDFVFDLTGASGNMGDAWAIVTAANVTYASTFTVAGFTEVRPGLWYNGTHTFSEPEGRLFATPTPAIVPEPGTAALLALCAPLAARRPRRGRAGELGVGRSEFRVGSSEFGVQNAECRMKCGGRVAVCECGAGRGGAGAGGVGGADRRTRGLGRSGRSRCQARNAVTPNTPPARGPFLSRKQRRRNLRQGCRRFLQA